MWKVAGQHVLLNIIPINSMTGTKRKFWCDPDMRGGWSHRPVQAPPHPFASPAINNVKSGRPRSTPQQNPHQLHDWNRTKVLVQSGHEGPVTPTPSDTTPSVRISICEQCEKWRANIYSSTGPPSTPRLEPDGSFGVVWWGHEQTLCVTVRTCWTETLGFWPIKPKTLPGHCAECLSSTLPMTQS